MKKGLFFIVILLLGWRIYLNITDGFSEDQILRVWPFEVTFPNPQSVNPIFNQRFYYLGKGAQVYAFESEDKNYVLKFFKAKHIEPNALEKIAISLPFVHEWVSQRVEKKRLKAFKLFKGYEIAYLYDREPSMLLVFAPDGLVNISVPITLTDKLGHTFSLDLKNVPFVLQEKGITLHDSFERLLAKGDRDTLYAQADQILTMVFEGYLKGIHDRDHGVMRNLAFSNGKPMRIDIGMLSYDPSFSEPSFYKDQLTQVALVMKDWLDNAAPELKNTTEMRLQTKLETLLHEQIDLSPTQERLQEVRARNKKRALPTPVPPLSTAPCAA